MKISVHIEADSAEDFADALEVLIKGGGNTLADAKYNSTVTLADTTEGAETPAQTEEKKKRRTKAEIEAEKAAAVASTPQPEPVATQPVTATVVVPGALTLDSLRNIAMPLNKHNDDAKKAVVELIKSYGVVSFGQIPEDKFPDVKAKLESIAFDFGVDLGL